MGAHTMVRTRADRHASTVAWVRSIDLGDVLLIIGLAAAGFIAWVLFSEMARWR